MKTDLLAIVGPEGPPAEAARAAMERVFPGAAVALHGTVESALAVAEAPGVELLALLEPTAAAVAVAAAARNRSQLPRWAVVACGAGDGTVATLAPALWQSDILAALLPVAWARQAAVRENEQFRGDLKAIGTRVVHDLRSPLGGILSTAEVMGEVLRDIAPEEAERTKRIIDSEEEILRLVRTLGALTAAFAAPVVMRPFNMGAPAGDALQRIEPKLLYRGDRVQVPATWPDLRGDERKCELIWTLLLQNVLSHTAAGRIVTVSWTPVGKSVRFTVADDGAGVPIERQNLLFWPFHRQHEPQAARGFGLPVVERLVRMQGGHCDYAAAPGGGAAFSFTLPGLE